MRVPSLNSSFSSEKRWDTTERNTNIARCRDCRPTREAGFDSQVNPQYGPAIATICRDAHLGVGYSVVWSVTRSHFLDHSDAVDVSQTVWLKLVEHLESIREPDRLGLWLVVTARNECLKLLKSRSRWSPTDIDEISRQVDATSDAPVDPLILDEETRRMARALELVPERCRGLLRMLASDPAPSYTEIAGALDIAIGTIGPRRRRCLENLRSVHDTLAGALPGEAL